MKHSRRLGVSTNRSDNQTPFSDEAALDIRAWYQARVRADSSQRVAAERFAGAVAGLREDGHSVREIARILEVPATSVYRQIARDVPDRGRPWVALADGVGAEMLADDETAYQEYREAHNRAWRHYAPAQDALDVGWDGERIGEALENRTYARPRLEK